MRRVPLAIAVMALIAAGCGGGSDRRSRASAPPSPVPVIAERVPEEAPPVGEFLNAPGTSVFLLDHEVELEADAATNIIAARDGGAPIAGLEDLDPIAQVGPVALTRIERFAANWEIDDPDPVLELVNTATEDELREVRETSGARALPVSVCAAIVDWREGPEGPFDSRSELLENTDPAIEIGPARMQDIENHVGLGRAVAIPSDTEEDLRAVAFSPDGLALIVGRSEAGASAYLYDPFAEDAFTGDVALAIDDDEEAETDPAATLVDFVLRPFDLSRFEAFHRGDVAWAPDGTFALAVGDRGKVLRYDRELGTWQDLSPGGDVTGVFAGVAIAPGGEASYIADAEGGRVLRLDLLTGEVDTVATGAPSGAPAFARVSSFAPLAEGGLAIVPGERGCYLAIQRGAATEIDARLPEDFLGAVFEGGSGFLVGSSGIAMAVSTHVVHVHGGPSVLVRQRRIATRSVRDLHGAASHPSGTYALLVGAHGELLLHDPARGSTSRLTVRANTAAGIERRGLRDVAFDPTGTFAIIVGERGALLRYTPSR